MWPLRLVTLALLLLFPVAWFMPLARARVLPLFSGSEISIMKGAVELAESDLFLSIVVALFAIVVPYVKTVLLLGAQFGVLGRPEVWMRIIGYLGKLSMTDVFLIAMYVVAVKGVGIGEIVIEWGLYFFTALVLASIGVTWMTERLLLSRADRNG